MPRGFEIRWQRLLERDFDSDEFADLLLALYRQLPPGTLAAELGRHFANERVERKPLPIVLADLTGIRQTTRIDGIMPFRIPAVNDLGYLAECFLDDAETVGLETPSRREWGALAEEISLCLLALVHRRRIRLDHRFEMDLQIECPYVGTSERKKELTLMGDLPLGGRTTVFTTPLPAERWLTMPAASVEHVRSLTAARQSNGELRIAEKA